MPETVTFSGSSGAALRAPVSQVYWDGLAAGELRFLKCQACAAVRHPPTLRCAVCGHSGAVPIVSAGLGTVESWVIPRRPRFPSPPAATDIRVVLVALDEGVRVLGHWLDAPESCEIGRRVVGAVAPFNGLPIPVFRMRT